MSKLVQYREWLDEVDRRIIDALSERFIICEQIGIHKAKENIGTVHKPEHDRRSEMYGELGEVGKRIYEVIHEESLTRQDD